ncbi:hypothetical protein QEZ40_001056, partial [Streptomyces katrae]|nr:hypothetical protein [Streptomyces katrae]
MSQPGAQDWWQKLYEDPDAAPDAGRAPDPGDTLDQRFRSASVLVTDQDPDPGTGPAGQAPPEPPALPGPRREAPAGVAVPPPPPG